MPTQISPGVNVTEIDLTTIVPAVATTEGAIAGVFKWGPIGERVLVENEQKLVTRFGKPTNLNPETFFTAASFLSYGNRLYVSRAANTTGNTTGGTSNTTMSAIGIDGGDPSTLNAGLKFTRNVKNEKDYTAKKENDEFLADANLKWIAKYPGVIGNSLKISVCDSSNAWNRTYTLATNASINSTASVVSGPIGSNTITVTIVPANYATGGHVTAANTQAAAIRGSIVVGDNLEVGNSTVSKQYLRVTSIGALVNAYYSASLSWTFASGVSTISGITTTNLSVGANVSGTGIASGTYITNVINSSAISISSNTTGVSSGLYTVQNPAKFTMAVNNKIRTKTDLADTSLTRYWEYFGAFDKSPSQSNFLVNLYSQNHDAANNQANDELHAVVVDDKGLFTGVPGTVLERFSNLSRVKEAKNDQGSSIYYVDAINYGSQYVWWANDNDNAASANAINIVSSTNVQPATYYFAGGQDGDDEATVDASNIYNALDLFQSAEDIDVSLILQGKAIGGDRGQQLANYIVDNICEKRKDCVAFISPNYDSVINNLYQEADDVIAFRNSVTNSSYAVLDSGYKYMYDRYNDVYRWVPLNGDVAGLCARTDNTNDPWYSPAGYNRGVIKNVARLAYNPSKAERDSLYKSDVNPVINIPGSGTILYGDKTLLGKPSAFDRINVRRLFIVLEKAISLAAKFTLFEFNDSFTRTQFRNLIEPYLRDVQGRRGIYDFKVVCDETNNTPEVIDSNQFVGDIYIKPARSINFIQLNFIAVRSGVSFNEIIGLRQ
jgi:phage tail sheath protein FI